MVDGMELEKAVMYDGCGIPIVHRLGNVRDLRNQDAIQIFERYDASVHRCGVQLIKALVPHLGGVADRAGIVGASGFENLRMCAGFIFGLWFYL